MTIDDTVKAILDAPTWAQRIAQIRLVPQRHGTGEHNAIHAAIARQLYMPHLAPDFAYIHEAEFYDLPHFSRAYDEAYRLTGGFIRVAEQDLTRAMSESPDTLLVFRTLLGLTRDEFAYTSTLVDAMTGGPGLTSSQVDGMERNLIGSRERSGSDPGAGRAVSARDGRHAGIAAKTIAKTMSGEIFAEAVPGMRSKQAKPDTEAGWNSVRQFAQNGVPLKVLLHQRHYGGAFRQVLDATSSRRGDLIEDAVEAVLRKNGVPFIRTGSHNQAEIADRFEVRVTPAPDFVVFDPMADDLRALIECKGTNNGGTARDKALRFERLRAESIRLNGVPLLAVLGGTGWARINDALAPVVRDTEGRVFTLSTLDEMMQVQPFPALMGTIDVAHPARARDPGVGSTS